MRTPSILLVVLLTIIYLPSSVLADVKFQNVAGAAGLAHQHAVITPSLLFDVGNLAIFSGGAAAGDFDGDGWMDLYVTRVSLPNQLFRNNGDGTFEEMGVEAGVALDSISSGCAWADIDSDGDQDLYVLTFGTRNYLYINDGAGHFEEQARERHVTLERDYGKLDSTSAAFGDVDNDGDLDLVTTAWQTGEARQDDIQTRLYINDGHGNFSDNTEAAGLTSPTSGFTPAIADVDQDGWQDILIAGDFRSSRFYHNQGNGVFVEKAEEVGVGTDENGMGAAVFDIDNDGDLDWFVSAIFDEEECEELGCYWRISGNRLYLNDGRGLFEDGTDRWGVRDGGWGWGASGLDFDNDGDQDLLLANGVNFDGTTVDDKFNSSIIRLWRNDGEMMTDIADESGALAIGSTRGVVVFDYDQDGDQDFYVANSNGTPYLFENVGTGNGHWFRVRLQGTRGNPDGVGALVRVTTADGRVQTRLLGNNSNYNSHNEPIVHFGLGSATAVVELEVEWPVSGWVQRFTNLSADQEVTIVEAEQSGGMPTDDPPRRGMYWDRSRSGHGFELQRSGDNWFVLQYTYREDRTPLWYLASGEINDGVFTGTAAQFDYDPGRSPPQQVIAGTGGAISIDFNASNDKGQSACDDGVDRGDALDTAVFDFALDGQEGSWCVEPFRFASGPPTPDFTGSWYNSQDQGWGLTLATQSSGAEEHLMAVMYYYDADGQPRWAMGSALNIDVGSEIVVEMRQFTGFCPGCMPSGLESAPAGTLRLKLLEPSGDLQAGNTVSVDLEYLGAPGGAWQRAEQAIQLLSEPNQ